MDKRSEKTTLQSLRTRPEELPEITHDCWQHWDEKLMTLKECFRKNLQDLKSICPDPMMLTELPAYVDYPLPALSQTDTWKRPIRVIPHEAPSSHELTWVHVNSKRVSKKLNSCEFVDPVSIQWTTFRPGEFMWTPVQNLEWIQTNSPKKRKKRAR